MKSGMCVPSVPATTGKVTQGRGNSHAGRRFWSPARFSLAELSHSLGHGQALPTFCTRYHNDMRKLKAIFVFPSPKLPKLRK